MKTDYKKLCTGCGLCHSVNGVAFTNDDKGFPYPNLSENDYGFCEKVCLASGHISVKDSGDIWGNIENYWCGWSADSDIRLHSSSGGAITSICILLLEKGLVNGVIQVKRDERYPWKTATQISRSRKDIIDCSGSRYSISTPLANILQMIRNEEKYIFVGKPCDVVSLRNYAQIDNRLNCIKYYFSFFCAGEPSEEAQKKLLSKLKCERMNDCKELSYRGDGWPGQTKAKNKTGEINAISYSESWGNILGRDIRKICRICCDGIGEAADLAFADAWYLSPDGTPDFSEKPGRNLIFARTATGQRLVELAIRESSIVVEQPMPMNDLKKIQKYQFTRRATLLSMRRAYYFCRIPFPNYELKALISYAKNIGIMEKNIRFFGAIKRFLKGKL